MLVAITREVSPTIARCRLTHVEREAIDPELAAAQHRRYEQRLSALGCKLRSLPTEPAFPDAVFVEDAAVVLDELAIVTRPGAKSRRGEARSVAGALAPYRRLVSIEAPGTLDGGDVLAIDHTVFVGRSSRTNDAGIGQLRTAVAALGYEVRPVEVRGCLHLKSAATRVARNAVLVNPAWIDAGVFGDVQRIEIDPAEPFGANALLVDRTVVYAAAYVGTRRRLESHGVTVEVVDVSELAKAEGGVTCCSLIFEDRAD